MSDPLVVMKDVNKHFGDLHVLKDINLEVGRGEVVILIGPSGSGKSTLCRTINRLETFEAGSITIDGKQRLFAEPPHMQASMLFLPSGAHVPAVGEEVGVRVRFTATAFDRVVLT